MEIYYRKFELIDDAIVYGVLKKSLDDIKRLSSRLKKRVLSKKFGY